MMIIDIFNLVLHELQKLKNTSMINNNKFEKLEIPKHETKLHNFSFLNHHVNQPLNFPVG